VDEVRRLKASDGPELHIWGSSKLLQTLIATDLVDEYRIWISPVVVGGGKRLFENGVPPRGLSLVATRSSLRGALLNTYRPGGPFTGVTWRLTRPNRCRSGLRLRRWTQT
jgi:dihydrofolate reductase